MRFSQFNSVYESNKELDDMFDNAFVDPRMHDKNKLELITEISELANETRHFKYWSNKGMNMDLVREEYADCVIMTLYFFHYSNISLDEEFNDVGDYDVVDIYGRLYELAISYYKNDNRDTIKEFFVTLIKLGYMIGFTDEDIIEASFSKINKNKSHFGGF